MPRKPGGRSGWQWVGAGALLGLALGSAGWAASENANVGPHGSHVLPITLYVLGACFFLAALAVFFYHLLRRIRPGRPLYILPLPDPIEIEAKAEARRVKAELALIYQSRAKPAFGEARQVVQTLNEVLEGQTEPLRTLGILSHGFMLRGPDGDAEKLDSLLGDRGYFQADSDAGPALAAALNQTFEERRRSEHYQNGFAAFYSGYRVLTSWIYRAARLVFTDALADQWLKGNLSYRQWDSLDKDFVRDLRVLVARPGWDLLRSQIEQIGWGSEAYWLDTREKP